MMKTEKIIIVGDRVLIKPADKTDKTNSGLYLPPNVTEKEKVQSGYVIKTGPGFPIANPADESEQWKQEKGAKYIPLQAKEGDYALFMKKDSVEIELDGEKMVIVPQHAILLLQRDEELFD
jgi:co-chaperonin GroES (HSP10)